MNIESFSSITRRVFFWVNLEAMVCLCWGQVTTGELLGTIEDPTGSPVTEARIETRHLETDAARTLLSDLEGHFRFSQLPLGSYEVNVEKSGFARYSQSGINLRLNQSGFLKIGLELANVIEKVNVVADASLLNGSNAEVSANFDRKRISELPLAPNRSILMLALSVAGVSQMQAGQGGPLNVAGSLPFAVNGMRPRSNNFIIDGQDGNSPVLTGLSQQLNNPDLIAEFRLITSQFAPEYGRAAGSVVNIVTKSGANDFHGSTFWFHNDNHLNSRNNLDPVTPFRLENQFGGTLGGPVVKNKTFFFGSLQRWTDRRAGVGRAINGVPTEAGRALLESIAGTRPTVRMLLDYLPPAQAPLSGRSAPLAAGGRSVSIPLGVLSATIKMLYNDWQWSGRADHHLSNRHTLGGRYLFNDRFMSGAGQVTPPGLSTVSPQRPQSASAFLNSVLSPAVLHELRVAYQRTAGSNFAENPRAINIPLMEITELGLTGELAGPPRTAIGLATDLPRNTIGNRYQAQSTLGIHRRSHSMKFGIDFRRDEVNQLLQLNARGRLVYATLQDLVDDIAQLARITSTLPGGSERTYYKQYDYAFFLQDEWRIRPDLALTYGIRYESPGNPLESFRQTSERIVAAHSGDPRFTLGPAGPRDTNNWAPRFGFNYRLPEGPPALRWLTGPRSLVLRGGYARTYDFAYLLVVSNVANSFPLVKSETLPARTPNSLEGLQRLASAPLSSDPNLLIRDLPSPDLRSPFAEQFALQLQREFRKDWLFSGGYAGTKGTALFQAVDVNPVVPGSGGRRLNPTAGVRTMRCNCTSSIYHSLQTSLEKRLSKELSMAAHYTWSSFIDGASDVIALSAAGELSVAQDSLNRRADRGRSSFDRPQRFAFNGVLELPFLRARRGAAAKILAGWQLSGFLTLQSGAPFTALDGADPGFRLGGIEPTVRANVNTGLDLARMSVEDIYRAGGARLFSRVNAASPLGSIGRNILRTDGIGNWDFGIFKNTRILEMHNLQFRAEFYNTTNTRNFGVPQGRVSSVDFLNQWGTDGGNRRIVLALRYVF